MNIDSIVHFMISSDNILPVLKFTIFLDIIFTILYYSDKRVSYKGMMLFDFQTYVHKLLPR